MNICIAHAASSRYSETFIRAHIEHLPAQTHELLGSTFSFFDGQLHKPISGKWSKWVDHLLMQKLGRPYAPLQGLALRRFFRRHHIKAVLAEYGPTGEALWRACKASGIPLIVHFHGFDAYRDNILVQENYREKYQPMFASAAALVVVSTDMDRQLQLLGAPPDKIRLVTCGVDVNRFSRPAAVPDVPRFLSTGRFVEKKAHYLTILAFQRVLQEVPEARLVILGEGPHLEVCQNIVKGLRLERQVEFPGAVSHDRVRLELERAQVFVLHSIRSAQNDSEGTPVSILEASAMGLPVVSTRHAGIVDAVEEGATGYLVDEGDVEGMSQRMIELARDPELCQRMGRAGQLKIAGEYSLERQIGKLWDVIKSAVPA